MVTVIDDNRIYELTVTLVGEVWWIELQTITEKAPTKIGMPTLKSVLNVKVLVGAFNQKKALLGAFSLIV